VIYENGKEDYRKITLNGRPINKKIEDMGGSWSTGEFGTVLIGLFSPGTAAEFHYRRDSRIAGILTKEYDFTVTHAHSNWTIHTGSQTYDPAYSGSVWIDPASARVMRIEMSARSFPRTFRATTWNPPPTTSMCGWRCQAIFAAGTLRKLKLPAGYQRLQPQCHRFPELPEIHRGIDDYFRGPEEVGISEESLRVTIREIPGPDRREP